MNNMFRNRNHQLMSVLSEQSILLFFNLLTVALFSFLDDEIDLNDLPTSPSSLHGTFKTTWVGQAQAESKKKRNGMDDWTSFIFSTCIHSSLTAFFTPQFPLPSLLCNFCVNALMSAIPVIILSRQPYHISSWLFFHFLHLHQQRRHYIRKVMFWYIVWVTQYIKL